MERLYRIQRKCSGLVTAVMLWSVVMPALAVALQGPPGGDGSWVEVCTSRGTLMLKRILPNHVNSAPTTAVGKQEPSPSDHGVTPPFGHCPYCPSSGLDVGLSTAAFVWVVATHSTATRLAAPSLQPCQSRWTLPPGNGPPPIGV